MTLPAPGRRRLGNAGAQAVVAYLVFLSVGSSNAPSPLYVIYQHDWGLSSLELTSVFAVYAIGVLSSLLVAGPLSDHVGRKPLIVAATAMLAASTLLFLYATSVGWLYAARFVQGVATGTMTGAAAAAIAELEPRGNLRRASVLTSVSFLTGAACMPLLFGFLAQYAPYPLRLPYLVQLGLVAVGGVLALGLPESRPANGDRSVWHGLQRPSVPANIRLGFAIAGASVAVAWAVGSLYSALSGSIESQLLHIQSHAYAGILLFVYNGLGGAGQLCMQRLSNRMAMLLGVAGVTIGMGLVQLSPLVESSGPFFAGTLVAGLGGGAAFMGALALVNELAPPQRRAEVVSAFSVVAYLAVAFPVVGVGLLAGTTGLETATGIFFLILLGLTAPLLAVINRHAGQRAAVAAVQGSA